MRGGQPRVDVAGVRRHGRAGGRGARRRHGLEELADGALQFALRPRVEAPAHGGRAHRVQALLEALADRATEGDLPVIDAAVEPTLRVAADPGLVGARRPVAAVIRYRGGEDLRTVP